MSAPVTDLAACEAALERPGIAAELRGPLARYAALLGAANLRMNLTAARSAAALADHIEDALALVPYLGASLADIGSGGGFPAVPLAIATGVPVLAVESVAKKARFLAETAVTLGLALTVVADRAEVAGRDPAHRERYASATARAVGALTVVLEFTMPFLVVGGRALLQRGATSDAERRALADAALVLGGRVAGEVGGTGDRRLLIVEKERPTQGRFPRRSGIPDRRPLCATGERAEA